MRQNTERSRRWAVSLLGDAFDVDLAHNLLGAGEAVQVTSIIVGETQRTVILAEEFEKHEDAWEVDQAATRIVNLLNGLLYVRDASRTPIRANAVHERRSDGSWSPGTCFGSFVLSGGARMRVNLTVLSPSGPPVNPPEIAWMARAVHDDVVADVLMYLRAQPDWFDVYKAFERMRDDINRKLGHRDYTVMGWPKDKDLDFFTESAQVYRHSAGRARRYDASNAMTLEVAIAFLRSLVRTWLVWRHPAA